MPSCTTSKECQEGAQRTQGCKPTNDMVWMVYLKGAKHSIRDPPATLGSFPSTCWYTSFATCRPQHRVQLVSGTPHSTLFAKVAPMPGMPICAAGFMRCLLKSNKRLGCCAANSADHMHNISAHISSSKCLWVQSVAHSTISGSKEVRLAPPEALATGDLGPIQGRHLTALQCPHKVVQWQRCEPSGNPLRCPSCRQTTRL